MLGWLVSLTVGDKSRANWVETLCSLKITDTLATCATVSARSSSASSCKLLDSTAETGARDRVSCTSVCQEHV